MRQKWSRHTDQLILSFLLPYLSFCLLLLSYFLQEVGFINGDFAAEQRTNDNKKWASIFKKKSSVSFIGSQHKYTGLCENKINHLRLSRLLERTELALYEFIIHHVHQYTFISQLEGNQKLHLYSSLVDIHDTHEAANSENISNQLVNSRGSSFCAFGWSFMFFMRLEKNMFCLQSPHVHYLKHLSWLKHCQLIYNIHQLVFKKPI